MSIKLFLLFHDAALPHSRYLLEGFAAHPDVSQLVVAYPEGRGSDLIFSAGSEFGATVGGSYQMIGLKSSRLRPKWVRWSALFTAIKLERPDYVVVLDEALYPNTLLSGLAVWCSGLKCPTVFYGFENIPQAPPLAWLRNHGVTVLGSFLRKSLRYFLFDRLFQPIRKKLISGGLVSYPECASVIKQTGWSPRIIEQWWGVDTKLFNEAATQVQGHLPEWQTNEGKVVIGFVGRYVPEKGVVDLLRAIQMLGNRFVLVCIGGGPLEVDILRIAEAIDVSSQLRMMPPMPPAQLASHIAAMDVLALPSHTDVFWKEQYGRVLVEAMAAAVPVIGSRSGAIPFVIGDLRRTFDEGNILEICDSIKAAISMSAEERLELQTRANKGDVSTFVQAYIDLYKQIRRENVL